MANPTCNHTPTLRVSCHDDLTSQECQSAAQRSIVVCDRPTCVVKAERWVMAASPTTMPVVVPWVRAMSSTRPQRDDRG